MEKKEHKSSSEIIVSFCDQNEDEIFHERFLEETPVATIVDSWNKNGGKLDQMWVILQLTNAKLWEELKIWGTDNSEIILNYEFDIDELIIVDQKKHNKLLTAFQTQLENNKKQLLTLFGVSNMAIDWAGPNSPNNKPPVLSYDFDEEMAWLNIRISIKTKELDKSLRIGDLLSNFNEVRELLDKIIAELQKIKENLNHEFLNENYFFMFSAHGAEAARAIVRAAWDKLENTTERISGIEMRRFLNDKMDEVAFLNKAGFLNHPEIWDTEPRDEILGLVAMKAKEVGYIDENFFENLWDWRMGGLLNTKSETSSNNIKVGFCDLDGYVFRGTFSQETLVKDIADILIKEKAQRAPEDWDLFFVQFEIPAGQHSIKINIYQKEGEIYIYYILNIAEILQIQNWELSRLFFDEQLEDWRKKTQEQYKFTGIEIPWLTETISDLQVKIRLSKTNLNKSFRLSDLQKNAYDISKILSLNPKSKKELLNIKEDPADTLLSISFCADGIYNELFNKTFSIVTPVHAIVDTWHKEGIDDDDLVCMCICIPPPFPNAKKYDMVTIDSDYWNGEELEFCYNFNIDVLYSDDENKQEELVKKFETALMSNKKQLESILRLDGWVKYYSGNPNNDQKTVIRLSFGEFEDKLWFCLRTSSIRIEDLSQSLRTVDLLNNWEKIKEIVEITLKKILDKR